MVQQPCAVGVHAVLPARKQVQRGDSGKISIGGEPGFKPMQPRSWVCSPATAMGGGSKPVLLWRLTSLKGLLSQEGGTSLEFEGWAPGSGKNVEEGLTRLSWACLNPFNERICQASMVLGPPKAAPHRTLVKRLRLLGNM